MTSQCPFCGFDQPEVTVFSDDQVLAFISSSPINRYHVLVVPKLHYEHLSDVPEKTLASVMRMAQRVSAAVGTVARPDASSLLSDADLTGSGYVGRKAPWKSTGPYAAIVEDPDGNPILITAEDPGAEM